MRICFQSIFNKTVFFKAIADRLENAGHEIYWTATSQKWTDWLVSRGVHRNRIMLLRHDSRECEQPLCDTSRQLLSDLESVSEICLKKIYYMDRVVSKWPWDKALRYFGYVASRLTEFVTSNEISVMIGEGTSSDEIINALVCERHQVKFYNPGTVRVPSDRFAFFKGHLMAEYEKLSDRSGADQYLNIAEDAHRDLLRGMKPNYWYWNNTIPTMNKSFLSKIIGKISEALIEARHDATVKPLSYHLMHQRQFLKPMRHVLMKLRTVFEQPENEEKYILYTLHKQPEASIDVFGADYANQYELIRNISRNLPHDIMLYVKEHSNCIGDRSFGELAQICSIPGVRLIDPFVDIHELIRNARAVVSVSGTVAFEAGLQGVPAGTFAKMYFNELPSIRFLKSAEEVRDLLTDCPDIGSLSGPDLKAFARILSNSCEGIIGDPLSTPVCMQGENIRKVAEGIEQLIEQVKRPQGVCKAV